MDEVPSVPTCPPVWLSVAGYLLPPTTMDPQPGEARTSSRISVFRPCGFVQGYSITALQTWKAWQRSGRSQVFLKGRICSLFAERRAVGSAGWGHKILSSKSPTDFPGEGALSLLLFPVGLTLLPFFCLSPCWSVDQAFLCLPRMYKSNFSTTLNMSQLFLVVLHIVSAWVPPPLPLLPPSLPSPPLLPSSSFPAFDSAMTVSHCEALSSLKLTVVLLPPWLGCLSFSSRTLWCTIWGVLAILSTALILDNRLILFIQHMSPEQLIYATC